VNYSIFGKELFSNTSMAIRQMF